jgi:hypothetical protein
MLKVLARRPQRDQPPSGAGRYGGAYLKTLENSPVGDTTKLSFEGDQEIRCWILASSSMLQLIVSWPVPSNPRPKDQRCILVKLVDKSRLYFWLLNSGGTPEPQP